MFAIRVFHKNEQQPCVTYKAVRAQIRHMVKDPPIQHEITLTFIAHTAPPENTRQETEETRLYWQNYILESTMDYALTKAS